MPANPLLQIYPGRATTCVFDQAKAQPRPEAGITTMKTATASWPTNDTAPQRIAILDAADHLLSRTPQRSTGNLCTVQLAVEADVKYWVVAQNKACENMPPARAQLSLHSGHCARTSHDQNPDKGPGSRSSALRRNASRRWSTVSTLKSVRP